jgi:hypothetical protein
MPRTRHRRDRAARWAWCAAITPSTNPGGDAGEQDHQRAQGAQCGDRRALAQGRLDLRERCSAYMRFADFAQASARRRTWCRCSPRRVTKEATHALMRQCRPGGGHRFAGQRARGLRPAARRPSASAPATWLQHRRRARRNWPMRRRSHRPLQDFRQRDQLLVREQRGDGRGRLPGAMLAASPRPGACCWTRRPKRRKLQARDVAPRQAGSPAVIRAGCAALIAELAGPREREALHGARFLMVEESGAGPDFPFSGEKLSPVLAVYRARDFDARQARRLRDIYAFQGAGHSVSASTARDDGAGAATSGSTCRCRA